MILGFKTNIIKMDKAYIVDLLKETALLLELHGENPFRFKSYQNAANQLDRLDSEIPTNIRELTNIKGIGPNIAHTIKEINEHGSFALLENLLKSTPQGVKDMLSIRGLGPKKVRLIWVQLGIDGLKELVNACESGLVAQLPGFGKKTQELILNNLKFVIENQNKVLYATTFQFINHIIELLKKDFPNLLFSPAGEFRRQLEITNKIVFVVGTDKPKEKLLNSIEHYTGATDSNYNKERNVLNAANTAINLPLEVIFCSQKAYYQHLILYTGSDKHLNLKLKTDKTIKEELLKCFPTSEEDFYRMLNLSYIEPALREGTFELARATQLAPSTLIEPIDIQGIIHVHTTYSDGKNSLTEMVKKCQELGYHYIGISDHSKSATYAGGLKLPQIKKQHEEIDHINQHETSFKILKGIESDILLDGSLDYDNKTLAKFDFIIASVHSGLDMDLQTATNRILTAIKNPFTTILGHPSGRLLLRRNGYPLNYNAIFDACITHNVIIEINANPRRLDLDWRLIHAAADKGVIFSINPDAHNKPGLEDVFYGIQVAQKGGLTKKSIFNAWPLTKVLQHLKTKNDLALHSLNLKT